MRAVITGMGALCATGHSLPEFLDSLRQSRSGTARLHCYEPDWFQTQVSAEVTDFSFDAVVGPGEQRHHDRYALLALAAADEAARDAGLDLSADGHRCGVVLGAGMGSSQTHNEAFLEVVERGRKPRPTTIPKGMYNAPAGHISIRYGCQGPSQTIVNACSASAFALGQALLYLRAGIADVCLAGGSEAFPARAMFAAWDTLRVMSRRNDQPDSACRPFSADRDGFVMGEAAAMLVVETEERARARGARIYGELAGVGYSSDAHHITQPRVEGLEAALRNALADAKLAPEDVGYVNAHGTATAANDLAETTALKNVFGDHARRLAVSSTKSATGHTIGAAGALEATATLLGLHHGFLPATLHLDQPDPACDLDYVPHEARDAQVDVALSNSFAFGGHNVVLALRRYTG